MGGYGMDGKIAHGRKIVIRAPELSDACDLAAAANSLVEEGADVASTTRVTAKGQRMMLSKSLKAAARGDAAAAVVDLGGVCVGMCQVTRDAYDVSRHVGTLTVWLAKEARGLGIGKRLVRRCLAESKSMGLKIVKLYVFETNLVAKRFYERLGFSVIGRIPEGVLHNGSYKDDILMAKRIAR